MAKRANKQSTKPLLVNAPRCPRPGCGSTERTSYSNVITRSLHGVDPEGNHYDTVVWRTTFCQDCGQKRVEKSFELRKKKTTSA